MNLGDFLTPDYPLGPFRHERIMKLLNQNDGETLLSQVDLFSSIISKGAPLIVGRRGSGKTAIVNAYLAEAGASIYASARDRSRAKSRNVYVFINSWQLLDDIIIKVGLDIQHAHGGGEIDFTSVLPETVSRKWARRFWEVVLKQLYQDYRDDDHRRIGEDIPNLIKYITGEDFIPASLHITDDVLNSRLDALIKEVAAFFLKRDIKCYVIVDSLEQYPVNSPKFQKVLAGFLKCVNEISDEPNNLTIICCLPEEIEHVMLSKTSNQTKDLSTVSSISRLRWRPVELLKIVADRYREFLKLHSRDDASFIGQIEKLNFQNRDQLRVFFGMVMPPYITNRHGVQENAIAYIVRHTQLLPREFIVLFAEAIKRSHAASGSWRCLDGRAIVEAITEQEAALSEQVLNPYKPLYPNLLAATRAVISELPPIFRKNHMDRLGGRLIKQSKHEVDDPWSMLFDIGVIGSIDSSMNPHSCYEFGRFHFNSKSAITFASDRLYCVHPLFSGSWNLRQPGRSEIHKFVYPADVPLDIWVDQK